MLREDDNAFKQNCSENRLKIVVFKPNEKSSPEGLKTGDCRFIHTNPLNTVLENVLL